MKNNFFLNKYKKVDSNKKTKNKQYGFWANIREITVLLLIVFLVRTFGFGLYQVPTGSMETTMLVGERFFADKFTLLFRDIKNGDIIAFNDPLYDYSSNSFMKLFQNYVWGPSNWTKRVIGIPGDQVRGMLEDGKPVVYLNGKKMDEPYINKYPLIQVCKISIYELQDMIRSGASNEYLGGLINLKSYDPNSSYDKQPFYEIKPENIIPSETGEPLLIYPGTPMSNNATNSMITDKDKLPEQNYWNSSDDFYVKLGKNQYWVMGDNRLGSKDSRVFGPIDGKLIHGKIMYRIWSLDSDKNWWIVDLVKHPIDFWKKLRWNRFFQRVR
jgi:signal peptidase I